MVHVDQRKDQLLEWLKRELKTDSFKCEPASSDASFRRYFRITMADKSYVAMDAPPAKEDCVPFVTIASFLREHGINAPVIYAQDLQQGFLLLSDLGTKDYLDFLTEESAPAMYAAAIDSLHNMHQASPSELPAYDHELLHVEMQLFNEWFLGDLLKIRLSSDDALVLQRIQKQLIESALEQPQVFVHRDYHSRNLMLTESESPGVIDFQDAVIGPITYDLVSLLRDCYIAWPDEQIYDWLDDFLETRALRGTQDNVSKQQFHTWFDLMGVQRHMKAIGIFSRLLIRDNKEGYLKDIPRTLNYILAMADRYEALAPLAEIVKKYDIQARFSQVLLKKSSSKSIA